jgi:four helix bundle protein
MVHEKRLAFIDRILFPYKLLAANKKEFVPPKQILSSGTAVGALDREAKHAQSKAGVFNKINVALKEADETLYWLIILKETAYITQPNFHSVYFDIKEFIKMHTRIQTTTKTKLSR